MYSKLLVVFPGEPLASSYNRGGYIVRSIQSLRAARVIAAYSRIHIERRGSFK